MSHLAGLLDARCSPDDQACAELTSSSGGSLQDRRLQSSPVLTGLGAKDARCESKSITSFKERQPVSPDAKLFFGPWEDSFELGAPIAKGAQGEVFVCTRRKTRRTYAVKKINLGSVQLSSKAGSMRTNLKREIQVMRELTHPKIVNLLEAFWDGNICFIVMDLAAGGSLHHKIIAGVGLGSERRCQHVAFQLLQGMGYMHSHAVIHRDLKPANVLITKSQPPPEPEDPHHSIGPSLFHEIKIADFGLSRSLKDPGGRSYDMTAVGTPAFVAPEVLIGTYNQLADYWSFGCIVYTMLCGEYPFDEQPEHVRHPGAEAKLRSCELWRRLSEPGKAFVRGLLKVKVSDRLGLRACLGHPWLSSMASSMSPQSKDVIAKSKTSLLPATPQTTCWTGLLGLLCRHFRWCSMLLRGGLFSHQLPPLGRAEVGVVQKLCGWSGAAVDSLEIWLRNGSLQSFGGLGGTRYRQQQLERDEQIIAVTQEIAAEKYLGNALVFFTSLCRVISIRGEDSADKARFIAPPGHQIVGLHFDQNQSCLVGIHIEPVYKVGAPSAVEVVSGWEGYAVDSVEFKLRNGAIRTYGSEGGDEHRRWVLQRTEYIVIAEQGRRDAYLGYSLTFYTSAGNILQLRGLESSRSPRFMVPAGRQVCGLRFEESNFVHVRTCPSNGNLQDIQTHEVVKL